MPVGPGGARPFGALGAVALAGASLAGAAAAGSIFLTSARDALASIAAAGPAGPADGIVLVAALGGVLLTLWLGLGMTLCALSALPGAVGHLCRRLAGRIAPAAVRKVVAFILGTTLTAALVPGSAVAGTRHEAPRPAVVATGRHDAKAFRGVIDAAPDASFRVVSNPAHDLNDQEAAPPPTWSAASPGSPKAAADGSFVVVHRGDTLWSIAARQLDPMATASDIDAECHRWFAANREVIGKDPNLVLPGQRLSPPSSPQENP